MTDLIHSQAATFNFSNPMKLTRRYGKARFNNLPPAFAQPLPTGELLNATNAKRVKRAGRDEVKPVIRFAFYAFIFSLAFETVDVGLPVEPTTLLGGLLVLTTLAQPGLFFRRPPVAFLFFVLYLCQCAIMILLLDDPRKDESARYLFVFSQLIILGWITYGLMRYPKVAKTALLMLVASCLILAFMQVAGIGTKPPQEMARSGRMTVLGFHPNNIARILALGVIILVGFSFALEKKPLKPRLLVLVFCAVIGIAVVQTGSRGALLAMGAGLLVFALAGRKAAVKIRNAVVVLLAFAFFTFIVIESEVTKTRFQSAMQQGELARREKIYPTAWQMIKEKPVTGWGPVTSSYELGKRLAHPREPSKNSHNLILEIFNVTGIIGAVLFFTGTGLALVSAWRARYRAHGFLPFALLITVLAANMSGLWHFNKLHWIAVAYALACASYPAIETVKRRVARAPIVSRPLRPAFLTVNRRRQSALG